MTSNTEHRIQAQALSLRVGKQLLLAPLDMTWQAGKVSAILGPNGAGKSSLLSLLSMQRPASSGQLFIHDRPAKDVKREQLARFRAFMPQASPVAFDFSVKEVVELGRYPHRLQPSKDERGIVSDAMATTQVQNLSTRSFNTLSGGEKARVHLARAMAQIWEPMPHQEARWLLLDEPTAALDLAHQQTVLSTVRRWALDRGVGVIAVLHDLNLALRYADQTLVLNQGHCVSAGETTNILTPALIDQIWGVMSTRQKRADGSAYLVI